MRVWLLTIAVTTSLVPIWGTLGATGESPDSCAEVIQSAFDMIDHSQFEELASELLDFSEDERAWAAEWLRITIREYGYPEDSALDQDIDLDAYHGNQITTPLPLPHETYKYRTVFSNEGDGVIAFRTGKKGSRCLIAGITFMLPKSREDAERRMHEISSLISAAHASMVE